MRNQIRIIGGRFKRRQLPFPDAVGLRPTADRVRETLFNWLGQDLLDLDCLDLFAGSGALGFEAASRHANRVVMLELNTKVYRQLTENRQLLGAQEVELQQADALRYLATTPQRFDVIFADPPFAAGLQPDVLRLAARCLKPDGLLYLEADRWPPLPAGWTVHRKDRAGQVEFGLLRWQPDATPPVDPS